MKKQTQILGSRIAELRKVAGLSQKELAEMCGISQNYISQIETGYRQPGYKLVYKITKSLNVTRDDLMVTPLLNLKEVENIDIRDKALITSMVDLLQSYLKEVPAHGSMRGN